MPKSLTEKDWSILLGRIRDGRCTPFLGPEACYPVLPPGNQLAHEWAEKCGYPLDDAIDLARVAQFLGVDVDPVHPKEKLAEEFKDVAAPDFTDPHEPHSVLADLPLPVYLTTNYDDFMTQALTSRHRDAKTEYCRWNKYIREEPTIFDLTPGLIPTVANPVVFHLHGLM